MKQRESLVRVGKPMIQKKLLKRLFAKTIIADNNCWIWTGASTNGYGHVRYDDRMIIVSRLSAHIFLGLKNLKNYEIEVCHKPSCHNRACWNPYHLYLGDSETNMRDRTNAGLTVTSGLRKDWRKDQTHCKREHLLQGDNVYSYDGKRYCRQCRKEAKHKRSKTQSQTLEG